MTSRSMPSRGTKYSFWRGALDGGGGFGGFRRDIAAVCVGVCLCENGGWSRRGVKTCLLSTGVCHRGSRKGTAMEQREGREKTTDKARESGRRKKAGGRGMKSREMRRASRAWGGAGPASRGSRWRVRRPPLGRRETAAPRWLTAVVWPVVGGPSSRCARLRVATDWVTGKRREGAWTLGRSRGQAAGDRHGQTPVVGAPGWLWLALARTTCSGLDDDGCWAAVPRRRCLAERLVLRYHGGNSYRRYSAHASYIHVCTYRTCIRARLSVDSLSYADQ